MPQEHIHLRVSGRVQGVGFRYSTFQTARALGLYGWVKNLPDGRVEAWAEGDGEKVDAFLEWCERGPTGARVDRVEIVARGSAHGSFSNFEILR